MLSGRIVESSSRSQKKRGLSWTRKERRRNIVRNGVRKPAGIDARGVGKQQAHEDARKMRKTKILVILENGRKASQVMIWFEKWIDREKFCSWDRKVMNCCKPEQVGTKEYGNMLKRIQVLEDGRVPAKEARNWKIEGHKAQSRGKNIRGF